MLVTHGSFTNEETAYFLHLTVRTSKPIVVVSSQRRHGTSGNDGDRNLLDAIRVATSPEAVGQGVLTVLNEDIHSARDVIKTSSRPDGFRSRDPGVLGHVDSDQVTFYRRSLRRHTSGSEFDIGDIEELPRVDIVYAYAGADELSVSPLLERAKPAGLIVAGMAFAGIPAPGQLSVLDQVSDRHSDCPDESRDGGAGAPPGRGVGYFGAGLPDGRQPFAAQSPYPAHGRIDPFEGEERSAAHLRRVLRPSTPNFGSELEVTPRERIPAPIAAVSRTLAILERLADARQGLTMMDVSNDLGISPSVTFRIMASLLAEGFVIREPTTERYQLSFRLPMLGYRYVETLGFPDFCQPVLQQLANETSELVEMSLVQGDQIRVVAKAEGGSGFECIR